MTLSAVWLFDTSTGKVISSYSEPTNEKRLPLSATEPVGTTGDVTGMAAMGTGSGSGVAGVAGVGLSTPPPVIPKTVPKPSGPQRVSSGVVQGLAISQPEAVYPPIAKAAHVQGVVVLHAIISKQGTIENLNVISGPPMLTGAAVDAVKSWRYRPYVVNGEPTEVETTINVNFAF
jgi:protein TonB